MVLELYADTRDAVQANLNPPFLNPKKLFNITFCSISQTFKVIVTYLSANMLPVNICAVSRRKTTSALTHLSHILKPTKLANTTSAMANS